MLRTIFVRLDPGFRRECGLEEPGVERPVAGA
jgi:hypothetical protein